MPSLIVTVLLRVLLLAVWVGMWFIEVPGPVFGIFSFLAGCIFYDLYTEEDLRRYYKKFAAPSVIEVPDYDGWSDELFCHYGTAEQIAQHWCNNRDKEVVQYAAIRDEANKKIWFVNRPGRHHHVLWAAKLFIRSQFHGEKACTQGFLTSYGRFVDRHEAAKIAFDRGQILTKPTEVPKALYSEDLFTNNLNAGGTPRVQPNTSLDGQAA